MISKEGLDERKWGHFPELRKIFEKYPVPDGVHGWTSVSDNTPAWIGRLIEIVATVRVHAEDLESIPQETADLAKLAEDLHELRAEIRHAAELVADLGAELDNPMQAVHRAAAAQEDEYHQKILAAKNAANK
jgi:hypothetical protein